MDEEAMFEMLNGHGGFHPDELFGGFGHSHRHRKVKAVAQPLNVTLNDLYNGKTIKFKVEKNIICKSCNGAGGKDGKSSKCGTCNGQGKRVAMRMVGPGMAQQCVEACSKCKGRGSLLSDEEKCQTCQGNRTVPEEKFLEVKVVPGMRHGQQITFVKEGDEAPGLEAGDIIFVIQCEAHEKFTRRGDDLFYTKELTMAEALCGHTVIIEQLDGRKLAVKASPGQCVKPNDIRCVVAEGMPLPQHGPARGNLYIIYKVAFPKNHFLDNEELYKELANAISRKHETIPLGEEKSLHDFEEARYQRNDRGEAQYDDDYEEMAEAHAPPGAQCAQQ